MGVVMKRVKSLFVFAVALSVAVSLGASTASAVGLDALIANNGSLQIGDKLFTNFEYTSNGAPDASNVDVQTIGTSPGGPDFYGLKFSLTDFKTLGGVFDALIEYDVTVTDPNWIIHDIHLDFDYKVGGTGFAGVTETVSVGTTVIDQAVVESETPTDMVWLDLAQEATTLHIQKDILCVAPEPGDFCKVSSIEQRYSQRLLVPEPASLLLIGSGLIGMAVLGKKKSA